jgi:hypothetical protein
LKKLNLLLILQMSSQLSPQSIWDTVQSAEEEDFDEWDTIQTDAEDEEFDEWDTIQTDAEDKEFDEWDTLNADEEFGEWDFDEWKRGVYDRNGRADLDCWPPPRYRDRSTDYILKDLKWLFVSPPKSLQHLCLEFLEHRPISIEKVDTTLDQLRERLFYS